MKRGKRATDSRPASVWNVMRPVGGRIRQAMAMSAAAAVLAVGAAAMLANVAHDLMMAPAQWPWKPLLGATLLAAFAYLLRLQAFRQSHLAAFRLEVILRGQLADHLGRVPLGYVQQTGSAVLAKIMMDDVKALHVFIADSTPLYARATAAPLATCVLLWLLDWRLASVACAILLLGLAVLGVAMRGSSGLLDQYNEAREHVAAALVEYVQAMPVVRTFDSGGSTFNRYQDALLRYRDLVKRWYGQAGWSSRLSIAVLGPALTVAALTWVGGWSVVHNGLEPSIWLAGLLVGAGMAESTMPLMALRHLVTKTQVSVHRIQEVLAVAQVDVPPPGGSEEARDASIRFEHVCFRYPGSGYHALDDVSFDVVPGSVTALVGPSGAGKTTAAMLIARFWDVDSGNIRIGGVNVRHMMPDDLMRQVSFVFQDTTLFADTMAANIRLGVPDAMMERVVEAARAAQIHDFIMNLPEGYDTQAGDRGVSLSGGQRQRVAIARAILQDRPILLLDEATAFSDPENEAALLQALHFLMSGKTVIVIAHRLPTIRHADQILVFDGGRIVERGRHDALVAQAGVYARLWTMSERAGDWSLERPDATPPTQAQGRAS